MFTLTDFIIFGVALVILLFALFLFWEEMGDKSVRLTAIIAEIIIMVVIIGGCGAYRLNTESGKRGLKSWKSETSGGLNRTVTVYDIKGKEIAKYTGRFDVEEDMLEGVIKVKFDDDKGKRHIIYAQTGTVLIDEN